MRRFSYVFLITSLIIALDQTTKYLVIRFLNPFDAIEIFPFLHLVSVRNTGAAFGMFKNVGSMFFITVSIIAVIFVVWLLIKDKEGHLSLSLILGGAIGNLIDRILFGQVVDFIDFSVGRFHWPAFNVADSALTIGIMLILVTTFFRKRYI